MRYTNGRLKDLLDEKKIQLHSILTSFSVNNKLTNNELIIMDYLSKDNAIKRYLNNVPRGT